MLWKMTNSENKININRDALEGLEQAHTEIGKVEKTKSKNKINLLSSAIVNL